MSGLVNHLLTLHGAVVYAIVAAFVFAEDALFIGFVLPGETAAVLGGVAASRHQVSVVLMIIIVVAAAILGDSVGYEIGNRLGEPILNIRPLRARREQLGKAQDFLARRGGAAVFLGRFIAFFRAVMPALAGISHMRYPKFLAYNAAGGAVWGTGVVLLGYLAGNSYATVEKRAGTGAAIAVAVVLVALLAGWRIRRFIVERRERSAGTGTAQRERERENVRAGERADRHR